MPVDTAAEEQFGPYLVYERLGIGGMATVHRALEQGAEGFERTVALKRLLPHLAEDASFIKSFVREAKLASILNHVNIVQIYELGRVGTEYFISMEYIDGRDLRRILRHARKVTGPPPVNITVGVMLQLCEALDYAHSKVDDDGHPLGLVHRDISPSNLIVTSGGHLKIIDFGIAKAQSSQLRTHTGRVKGKLAYMAPEAVSGSRDLDARSDIWATGVILHELLTARPLFASKNEYQTLLKVQRGDILPPSTFNQSCPRELDAIVFRALERDPDQRFPNASELREELLDLKKQYGLPTGYRDIASWLDWAFSQDAPTGFSGHNTDSVVISVEPEKRKRTPLPSGTKEEEEAVETVWGAGGAESQVGPVVLEDVPDVSEKHRIRRDTDDDRESLDDIPTPLPSHGTMPSIYGTDPNIGDATDPRVPALDAFAVSPEPPARIKHDTAPTRRIPTPDRSGPVSGRTGSTTGPAPYLPHRTPTPTGPPPQARPRTPSAEPPSRPHTSSSAPELPPPPSTRERRTTDQGVTPARPASDRITGPKTPIPLDAPQLPDRIAAQRARDERAPSDIEPATNPFAAKLDDDSARFDAELDAAPTIAEPRMALGEAPPVVRFAKSPTGSQVPLTPATKPGIAVVRAATTPRTGAARGPRSTPAPPIGAAIAARAGKSNRIWIYVGAGLVVAGAIALTAVLLAGGDHKQVRKSPPPSESPRVVAPAPSAMGTLKFVTEPVSAEIRIAGQPAHTGAPWAIELPAGMHQIEIHNQGYKAWQTSLELAANETQTLRVVLEPLAKNARGDATLTLTTTPGGLELVLDGKPFAQRTPLKTTLKPGAHTIAVRQNGVEVWRHSIDAEASTNYEFNPTFTEDKLAPRGRPTPAPSPLAPEPKATEPVPPDKQDVLLSPGSVKPGSGSGAPAQPAPAVVTPTPQPPVATPVQPAPAAPPKPLPAPTVKGPLIVPPSAVTKVAGDPPSIDKFKNVELPAALAAKVCIDETGKVASVDMVTKVERRIAVDLSDTLLKWRYAPYLYKGTPIGACFVVSFRVK